MTFPENFTWGATASAYQIEGAWDQDGKSPSIWDMFTRPPAAHIADGHNGRVACDHYHRAKADVALMREIGLKAYRFSISWPRVIPEGKGAVNKAGLDFYDRLVDELLARKIQPWVTLFHWDFPYALFLQGGWLNPHSPEWFAEYTAAVVKRLSDRVAHWTTVNDTQSFIGLGHMTGEHAPGFKFDLTEALLAGHHCLLAHGRAVQSIREHAKCKPTIGWSPGSSIFYPATNTPEDINAARQATLAIYPGGVWNNRWWSDPVVFGRYPEEGLQSYGSAVPKYRDSDMKIIRQPIDFYGCNIFFGMAVKAGTDGVAVQAPVSPGHPATHYQWINTPEALYWGPRFLSEHYHLPIVVTENGMSGLDWVGADGQIHDSTRIEFLNSYLFELRRAVRDRVDIRGYFTWSLMDNFEWNEGYRHRFGLIHVNFKTLERTLKDSAHWYREVIASNGSSLDRFRQENDEPIPYVIKETMHYVHAHVHEPFNVKDLAAHLRCHPDFLSRKFKKFTGTDLSFFIRKARIDYAKELLKNPKMLIEEAAERSGFADRLQFSKVFRRVTGETPGRFQRKFRLVENNPSVKQSPLKPINPRGLKI